MKKKKVHVYRQDIMDARQWQMVSDQSQSIRSMYERNTGSSLRVELVMTEYTWKNSLG